mmetsp:Transcript_68961/g.147554  ORF Transcript_68961/g.147554 Transcript_68961/m.147554 type:complete len:238 (-) Transcript_68961:178-891(-)
MTTPTTDSPHSPALGTCSPCTFLSPTQRPRKVPLRGTHPLRCGAYACAGPGRKWHYKWSTPAKQQTDRPQAADPSRRLSSPSRHQSKASRSGWPAPRLCASGGPGRRARRTCSTRTTTQRRSFCPRADKMTARSARTQSSGRCMARRIRCSTPRCGVRGIGAQCSPRPRTSCPSRRTSNQQAYNYHKQLHQGTCPTRRHIRHIRASMTNPKAQYPLQVRPLSPPPPPRHRSIRALPR